MLYRLAVRLMDQRDAAEDLLQEALLKVHQSIPTFGVGRRLARPEVAGEPCARNSAAPSDEEPDR